MARYGADYDREFGRDRGMRGREMGGMRSDGWGSDWREFEGEEGWYGGRGYDRGFRGGMRGQEMGNDYRAGGYGGSTGYAGREMGHGGGDFGSRGHEEGGRSGGRNRMRASEIMTEDPEVVTPDATLQDVARRMRERDVGIIPVVESEDDRRLRGVITDRDIAIRAVAEGMDGSAKVSDCMTTQVETVNKNDSMERVVDLMEREQVRRVPVTDREGRLVGIIAQADVALDYADTSHSREHRLAEMVERVSQPSRHRH
jgi:CBS domain-containing protein